jgi:hypothetical protein
MSLNKIRFASLLVVVALAAACKPSAPAAEAPIAEETKAEQAKEENAPPVAQMPTEMELPTAKPAVALPPEACTLDGSREFFEQFVDSAEVRRAYSKLDLKAGIAAADAAAHPNFDGFRIGKVDNRWVLVDPTIADVADYPRVEIKSSLQGNTFKVDYTKARFTNGDENVEPYGETAGYSFEFIDGCWTLTGQTPAR